MRALLSKPIFKMVFRCHCSPGVMPCLVVKSIFQFMQQKVGEALPNSVVLGNGSSFFQVKGNGQMAWEQG
jgi:hypothetical protein